MLHPKEKALRAQVDAARCLPKTPSTVDELNTIYDSICAEAELQARGLTYIPILESFATYNEHKTKRYAFVVLANNDRIVVASALSRAPGWAVLKLAVARIQVNY